MLVQREQHREGRPAVIKRTSSLGRGGAPSLGHVHIDDILLDLRRHENVTAWAALWRVLHGSNFAPAVQIKFQFYCLIGSAVFFISAFVDSMGEVMRRGY